MDRGEERGRKGVGGNGKGERSTSTSPIASSRRKRAAHPRPEQSRTLSTPQNRAAGRSAAQRST